MWVYAKRGKIVFHLIDSRYLVSSTKGNTPFPVTFYPRPSTYPSQDFTSEGGLGFSSPLPAFLPFFSFARVRRRRWNRERELFKTDVEIQRKKSGKSRTFRVDKALGKTSLSVSFSLPDPHPSCANLNGWKLVSAPSGAHPLTPVL